MRHHNHLDFRMPSELDNPDNRVLLAFFFIFSEMWVAEFLAQRFDVPRAREGNWRERRDSNQRVQRACFPFPRISL